MPPRIGLTGGIGSGKSTVATIWRELGACVVDTDAIARRITGPGGQAMPAIRAAFGDAAVGPDGALDRARMRELAFGDSGARQRLEAIVHPLIGALAQHEASQASGVVVFDVPLLAESAAWRGRCTRILVVDCPEDIQLARVVARSGWPEAQVREVIAQQASRVRRRAIADAVVYNHGIPIDALRPQVRRLFDLWVHGVGFEARPAAHS